MLKLKSIFCFLAITVFLIACTSADKPANDMANNNGAADNANAQPSPTALDEIAEGKKHYVENCAKCHKEDGTGGPVEIEGRKLKPDDLTSEKMAKEPDEEYLEYMEDGIPDEGMPSFKDVLSEEQMKMVVKYIRKELQ